ncbi:MAG: hypothetical protein A3C53_07220 [Omnitrophica WOR_2 bacterium RIFCSPHIGHO2_02_FULL_68_15]|nr:MAG: hypothetical protein A3C53_07220 [Omnitrophica WOR_2 bacterium RIFCSPHIGHO2_02_FULL_68_15]
MRHRTRAQSRVLILLILIGLLVPTLAWAEKVELVTYYPAPAAAAGNAPQSPQTIHLEVPFDSYAAYDVYATLRLWETGKTREQLTTTMTMAWKAYAVTAAGWTLLHDSSTITGGGSYISGGQWLPTGGGGHAYFNQWTQFSTSSIVTVTSPIITNGVITVDRRGVTGQPAAVGRNTVTATAGDVYEVTVTW